MLDDGPGERHAVVSAGAAADLVQNHQASWRGQVEDPRRLGHLDHERALAARQLVARADAGENAIGHADRGFRAGTKLPICAMSVTSATWRM